MSKNCATLICGLLWLSSGLAANSVFYAGGAGRERFNDIHRLSDGTLLVAGQASDLNWLAANVPRTQLAAGAITSSSAGNIGFILHLSGDFTQVLRVVHFPAGSVRDVFKMRSTEVPGEPTGTLYISGARDGTANDGYYLARLNGNFVTQAPTALSYGIDVQASGDHKERQPWDVGSDGKLTYVLGQTYGADWAAIQRLNVNGIPEVVQNWTAHWRANSAGEWNGAPASSYTGMPALTYSAIVMKVSRRGSLRSATAADFQALSSDANGNAGRQGKFPDDYYFTGACELAGTNTCPNTGPGYTGYRMQSIATQRVGDITVDRRNNDLYFGYSTKSTLPGGNPDFEPAIVAMRADGSLKWWDRLYRETTQNSSPDQYLDGLALDYRNERLVVLARTHGNNVINFWSGNALTFAPSAAGFQNRFSGTNGNIHLSWIGKFALDTGKIYAASYLGELAEGTQNFGSAYTDAHYAGWPNFNAGWPNLNTTRCGADAGFGGNLAVFEDGSVAVACAGRRSFTTIDAFQSMPRPNQTPVPIGSWNQLIRVYSPDLSAVRYSTILTGAWDASTGIGGDNTRITAIAAQGDHILAAGWHADTSSVANGNPMPIVAVPSWGASTPNAQSGILARLTGTRMPAATTEPPFNFTNGFE